MGWTYNTADDVANDGPRITAVAVALTSASLSILLVRLYVRIRMIKAIGIGMQKRNSDRFGATLTKGDRRLDFDSDLGESAKKTLR
jgi:hypothetical protein